MTVGKELIRSGFGIGNLVKVGSNNIIIPCIIIADLPIPSGAPYDAIKAGDFKGTVDNTSKVFKDAHSLFSNDSYAILLSKLTSLSDINIAVPDNYIPIAAA